MHLLRLRAGSQLPDGVAVGVGAGLDGSDAPALGLLLRCLLLHDALDQLGWRLFRAELLIYSARQSVGSCWRHRAEARAHTGRCWCRWRWRCRWGMQCGNFAHGRVASRALIHIGHMARDRAVLGIGHARAGLTAGSHDSASRPGSAIIFKGLRTDTQRTTPSRSGHAQDQHSNHDHARPPLLETDGPCTRGQVRRCVHVTDQRDLHQATRGFLALHARQPPPTSIAQSLWRQP